MTQGDPVDDNDRLSTSSSSPLSSSVAPGLPPKPEGPGYSYYPTDTIAAVTIAVLAVVIILTLLLVIRALRKRRRARQGEQFGHVQTVTTGIMGTGGSAYSNAVNSVPVRGPVSWESVNPSTENQSSARTTAGR